MSIAELDDKIRKLLEDLDTVATDYDGYVFGLPLHQTEVYESFRNIVCQFLIDIEELNVPTNLP